MIGLADINAVDQRSKEGGHSETQKVEKRCHVVGSSQAGGILGFLDIFHAKLGCVYSPRRHISKYNA